MVFDEGRFPEEKTLMTFGIRCALRGRKSSENKEVRVQIMHMWFLLKKWILSSPFLRVLARLFEADKG